MLMEICQLILARTDRNSNVATLSCLIYFFVYIRTLLGLMQFGTKKNSSNNFLMIHKNILRCYSETLEVSKRAYCKNVILIAFLTLFKCISLFTVTIKRLGIKYCYSYILLLYQT